MKVKKRDVNNAERAYSSVLLVYGPDNLVTIRAEILYRDLKQAWESQHVMKKPSGES